MRSSLSTAMLVSLLAGAGAASGQAEATLTPGDVVRVNHDFVGTLMSIDGETTLTVMGEGRPVCWPGIGHGDAPRCDPAPLERRVVDWTGTTIERQLVQISYTRRTVLGFLIGAVAMGPIGYATGPSLGYGKIDACYEVSDTRLCTDSLSREEFDRLQRSQDQSRGALAFALFGGTVGAIVARRTANEWLLVEPPATAGGGEAWTVGVRVPLTNR